MYFTTYEQSDGTSTVYAIEEGNIVTFSGSHASEAKALYDFLLQHNPGEVEWCAKNATFGADEKWQIKDGKLVDEWGEFLSFKKRVTANQDIFYVVHGCGVADAGEGTEGLNPEGILRVYGLKLALLDIIGKEQPVPQVIFSGGVVEQDKGQTMSEAEYMFDFFRKITTEDLVDNLDPDGIVLEPKSVNSIENIDFTLEGIKGKLGESSGDVMVKIVSSNTHLRRLLATWKRRIDKGGYNIKDVGPIAVFDLLKSIGIENLPPEIQSAWKERKKRPLSFRVRSWAIELFGYLLAKINREELITEFKSNMSLPTVAVELCKKLFSPNRSQKT